ncbi:MAG TPA: DedA family protein [Blastocatellia bacterium]|jgi:membrane-associated protein|nr:DedA family protein [Blastocatellia bacterium]
MELVSRLIDLFLHLDRHLNDVIRDYGPWTYLILFLIVFAETGLVVTPLLPGDSLLFAAGALAAISGSPLDVGVLFLLLAAAAILGDTANYWIGSKLGPKVFHKQNVRFLNREYLDRTHQFYEKYGGKTIIIARFIPIIRTFAPFVAGIGRMTYWRFLLYNVVGGILWVAICLFAGYWFGNIPIVKKNFSIVIIAIVLISIIPPIVEYIKHRRASKAKLAEPQPATEEIKGD